MLGYLSAAADAAGLGDVLKTQTEDETEEMRRRRILLQQMKSAVNPMPGSMAVAGARGNYGFG
jgi:hypothetical protein